MAFYWFIEFAHEVRTKFKTAEPEEKKLILKQLGSNFFIYDTKISIDLEKTYKTLSESKKWGEKYSDSLEPAKYADILVKSPDLRPANPVWLASSPDIPFQTFSGEKLSQIKEQLRDLERILKMKPNYELIKIEDGEVIKFS